MFDNIAAMFGGGLGVGAAGMVSLSVQGELQQLKSAPVLNPHFGMVIKYLDCLNRLMDGLVLTMGPSGVTPWLVEVQTLIRLLQKRVFQRMPLTMPERSALLNFASYWRRMVQPPYAMGRPEAQLVLITLTELASK
ncbi:hypothetical protein BD324DRAFT_627141 [Kockovaella imperatae]|uniref:Uncharacterized protein n=1 Tax=Kockovaella imperatae TaxID=4999 RepID=A0A1Y1UGX3_9TREE|nr:hypothetical protein BD324DRAFT_627141 [Kockovaella imperatae]ORX36777.1 hypothetical protein BD324DRAFT_627141 [Kockovaella imperatae]